MAAALALAVIAGLAAFLAALALPQRRWRVGWIVGAVPALLFAAANLSGLGDAAVWLELALLGMPSLLAGLAGAELAGRLAGRRAQRS